MENTQSKTSIFVIVIIALLVGLSAGLMYGKIKGKEEGRAELLEEQKAAAEQALLEQSNPFSNNTEVNPFKGSYENPFDVAETNPFAQ